jgi:hypothetical protein
LLRRGRGTQLGLLILRNWLIGAFLVEFEQSGEDRAKYGTGLKRIDATISSQIRRRALARGRAD